MDEPTTERKVPDQRDFLLRLSRKIGAALHERRHHIFIYDPDAPLKLAFAAAQIDTLQARVEELERERDEAVSSANAFIGLHHSARSQLADARAALTKIAYHNPVGRASPEDIARAALDKGDG